MAARGEGPLVTISIHVRVHVLRGARGRERVRLARARLYWDCGVEACQQNPLTIIVILAQNCLHSLLVDLVEDEKVYFHSLTVNRLEDLNERPSVLRSTTCPTHQPTTRQL